MAGRGRYAKLSQRPTRRRRVAKKKRQAKSPGNTGYGPVRSRKTAKATVKKRPTTRRRPATVAGTTRTRSRRAGSRSPVAARKGPTRRR